MPIIHKFNDRTFRAARRFAGACLDCELHEDDKVKASYKESCLALFKRAYFVQYEKTLADRTIQYWAKYHHAIDDISFL